MLHTEPLTRKQHSTICGIEDNIIIMGNIHDHLVYFNILTLNVGLLEYHQILFMTLWIIFQ